MKKLALLFAGAMIVGTAGAAVAASDLNTPAGNAAVGSNGYIVMLDGNSANPDPLDGYVGVDDEGGLQCGAQGGPFNDDGSNNALHVDNGCNPEAPAPPA